MGKLSTPDWIKEGFDSKADWEKAHGQSSKKSSKKVSKKSTGKSKSSGKMFKIRKCPKCDSTSVHVVLVGEEGKKADNWECGKCKWKGRDIVVEEISEEEFLKLEGGE